MVSIHPPKRACTDVQYEKGKVASSTSNDGERMFLDPGFADDEVTFKFTDGMKLYVSKSFLQYSSPVFEKMFTANFRERSSNIITLKNKTFEDFRLFLMCLQQKTPHEITHETVYGIFSIAHEYQAGGVTSNCEKILKEVALNDKSADGLNCLTVISFASYYNLASVLESTITAMSSKDYNLYYKKDAFVKLPDNLKVKVMDARLRWRSVARCY